MKRRSGKGPKERGDDGEEGEERRIGLRDERRQRADTRHETGDTREGEHVHPSDCVATAICASVHVWKDGGFVLPSGRVAVQALAAVPAGTALVGVHKRVDNPGTARMQFDQVLPATSAYVEAVKKLADGRGGVANVMVVLATDDAGTTVLFGMLCSGLPQHVF